jgi:hypothetical protein
MPVPPASPQDSNAILVIALLIASFCAFYWKTALRLVAAVLIALVAYGLIVGLHVR